MRTVIATVLLAGCASAPSPDAGLPVASAPPPLLLDVGDLYEGGVATFTLSGAVPGDWVLVGASRSTALPGFCPPWLQGSCLQLDHPILVGATRANAVGEALIQVPIPAYVTPGTIVWFQAAGASRSGAYTSSRTLREAYAADCPQIVADFWAEADAVRHCTTDPGCGQVMLGTSCGCTRDWVANLSADLTDFYRLLTDASRCGVALVSTCDCPPASGFVCDAGTCQWNYTGTP